MPDYEELIHFSAKVETENLAAETPKSKSFLDYLSLSITTFGVGYLPLAPGTWGSMVGVVIYLLFARIESSFSAGGAASDYSPAQITAWLYFFNASLFTLFCLLGIWAANRATKIFRHKDPSQAIVDEIIGQLLVFMFVPFAVSWKYVLSGFLLFRLFDIWKPYPIDSLQNLPAGIGVCADDILAGVYAGICLAFLYALGLSL